MTFGKKKQTAVCLLACTLGNPSNLSDQQISRWQRVTAHMWSPKKARLSGGDSEAEEQKTGQMIRPGDRHGGLQSSHLLDIPGYSRASVPRRIGREFKSRGKKDPQNAQRIGEKGGPFMRY